MAFSLRATAEYEDANSGVIIAFSPSVDIEVGDTIVMGWDVNNALTGVLTCVDNSTQAGAANVYVPRAERSGTAFSAGTCYILATTRKILTTDVITITVDAGTPTRRTGQMMAVTAANGNPRFELQVGTTADSTSPVLLPSTPTLYTANSFVCLFNFWKGGAVASGISAVTPAGTAIPGGGALSGGITTRVETNAYYILDTASNAAITPTASYTTITMAHAEMLVFSDEVPAGPAVIRGIGAQTATTSTNVLANQVVPFIQTDDLEILFVAIDEAASISSISGATMTQIGTAVSVTGGRKVYAYWRKFAVGAADPQINLSVSAFVIALRVAWHCDTWDNTTPTELPATGFELTSDTSFSFATGTTTTDVNRLCVVMYSNGVASLTGQSNSPANASLTSVAMRAEPNSNTGIGGGFVITTGLRLTAGTMGTWTDTYGTASAKAYLSFAIRPWATAAIATFSPQVALSRSSVPYERAHYLAPLSQTYASPYETPPQPPAVGGLAQSRAVLDYSSVRSQALTPFDPAYNVFSDWTPGQIKSRPQANYLPPRSLAVSGEDAAYNVLRDIAGLVQSRPPVAYSPPRSRALPYWEDFHGSEFAASVQGFRAPPRYTPPPSRIWGLGLEQPPGTEFAGSVQSWRAPFRYAGGPSSIWSLIWEPVITPGTEFAGSVQGFRSPFRYSGGPSAIWNVLWEPVAPAPGTETAGSVQSRVSPFRYTGGLSQALTPFDPAYNVLADWAAAAVASKPGALARAVRSVVTQAPTSDVGPVLALFVASRILPAQPALRSQVLAGQSGADQLYSLFVSSRLLGAPPAARSQALTGQSGADQLYSLFLASRQQILRTTRSLVFQPVAPDNAALDFAQFVRSRLEAARARVGSAALTPITPPQPAEAYTQFVYSSGTLADVAVRSLVMMPFGEGAVIVTPAPNSGGGGEWVIWTRPDFPANRRGAWPQFNRPQFRKPTRRVP